MRLQLDPAVTGSEITNAGTIGHAGAVTGAASSSSRVKTDSTSGDSIRISGPTAALNSLATSRAARIQQLTAAVQGGTYQVSGALVSRAMIADATS